VTHHGDSLKEKFSLLESSNNVIDLHVSFTELNLEVTVIILMRSSNLNIEHWITFGFLFPVVDGSA